MDYNKCTPLVGSVDNEGDYACVGIWKFSVFCIQFCCEHKTCLKNISLLIFENVDIYNIPEIASFIAI